jgi:tRNA pseudouridine38-40 synthase
VQSVLEAGVQQITGRLARVSGAGRTDAGAHALGQVIAFSTESLMPAGDFRRALNAVLPRDVSITDASEAPLAFHPRFDALSRTYRYMVWNRAVRSPFYSRRAAHVRPVLDESRMNQAAQTLVGRHDFSSFVAATAVGTRVRTMFRAACKRDGDLVAIELEANGFMRQMARAIAGTLIDVGCARLDDNDMSSILTSRDRHCASATAPAHGLYLVNVRYPDFSIQAVSAVGHPAAEDSKETA